MTDADLKATLDITPLVVALAHLARDSLPEARRGLNVLEALIPGITVRLHRELSANLAQEVANARRH